MKMPEEIKTGLECCDNMECERCPYRNGDDCVYLNTDALAYIQQLEAEHMRHGRWDETGGYNTCSICGRSVDRYDDGGYLQDFSWCPYCGAKMDGGEDTNVLPS